MRIKIQLYTVPGQVMYNATRRLVLKGADGVVLVADSRREQREENIESLHNLRQNLSEEKIDFLSMPVVLQYNKRDLAEQGHSLLSREELDDDLNSELKAPTFEASALRGDGVFESLREVSKLTVKRVTRRLLMR